MANKLKNKDRHPIYYKNAEEMDKPISVLIQELRNDISNVRGKLNDIKSLYGFDYEINYLNGGLTCMIVAMHSAMEEFVKHEKKQMELSQ